MSAPQLVDLDFATPEDLLRVRPDAHKGIPIDAITTACERANAVLMLLSGQFCPENDSRFSDAIIAGAIWDVQGTIEQIKTIALYAHKCAADQQHNGGEA